MADMAEHILLIDDDMRLSAMVADYLRSHGYQVATAASLTAGREPLGRQAMDAPRRADRPHRRPRSGGRRLPAQALRAARVAGSCARPAATHLGAHRRHRCVAL